MTASSRVPGVALALAAAYFLMVFAASCSKEKPEGKTIVRNNEDPVMSASNVDALFSDSGRIQARITSPLTNQYIGTDPRMEFPKGFLITVYDSLMQVSTTITANRGVRYDGRGYMEAIGKVVVRNEKKNEQLNTEHLIWDDRRHRIYNNEPIKITTPGKILYGNDLESDEAFSKYSFKNPTGQMMVRKDSL
jgi:LPS export ABC transporter protein LptC